MVQGHDDGRPAIAAASAEAPRPRRVRDTWPLHKPQLLQLAIAYATLTGLFVLLGLGLTGSRAPNGWIVRADQRVAVWFARHRTEGWNDASWWASALAETVVKIAVTVVVCAVLVVLFRRWFEAAVVAVPLVLEAAAFLTVTLVVGRPRPDVARLDGSPVDSSFPSGHTAAAVCYAAFAVVLFWHTCNRAARLIAAALVTLVPAAVALARMYRGMHHASDVLAGALLGLSAVLVSLWILLRTAEADEALGRAGTPARTRSSPLPPIALPNHGPG